MLLPKDSIFGPSSPRWEIGGKVFKACMYYVDPAVYPNIAYVAFLVKRPDQTWYTLYKSDSYWLDIQDQLGAQKISEFLVPHFNVAIRQELGLPDLDFNAQINEYLNGSTKVIGNMIQYVK